jgi:hypothetical protein
VPEPEAPVMWIRSINSVAPLGQPGPTTISRK